MGDNTSLIQSIREFFKHDPDADQWFDRPVPDDERLGLWQPTSVWIGFAIAYVVAFIGSQIYFGLGMPESIYAIVLGNLVLAVYSVFIAIPSSKGGLNFPLQVKEAFGTKGAAIPILIMGLLVNGWYAYQAWLAADVVRAAYSPPWILIAIGITVLFGLPALIGVETMSELVSKLVMPLVILAAIYMLAVRIIPAYPEILNQAPPGDPLPFMVGVGMAWSTFAVSGTMTGDIVRFTENTKQATLATIIAFLVFNTGMLLLGALAAAAINELSLYFGMIGVAASIPLVVIALMSCWSTCDATLYNATLAYSNVFEKVTWRVGAVAGIAVATVAAVTGIISNLLNWLVLIGLLVPPIGGIIIGDYYLVRRGEGYDVARTTPVNWPAVATLVVAVVINYHVYQNYPEVLFGLPGLVLGVLFYPPLNWLCVTLLGEEQSGHLFRNDPAGSAIGFGSSDD